MTSLRHLFLWLLLIGGFAGMRLRAQDRPWVELSVSVPYAASISNEGEFTPVIFIPVNYVFNPRLTAGIHFISEEIVSEHPVEQLTTDTTDMVNPVRYAGGGQKIQNRISVQGFGVNVKYNLLANPNYRIFVGLQYSMLSTSLSGTGSEREYAYETPDGSTSYVSGSFPFENKSHSSINFNIGCDFRLTRSNWLYFMWDYQDLFKSMDYYYKITKYATVDRSGPVTFERIDKVEYTEQKDEDVDLIMHLQLGLRFYLFDRKL